MYQVLARKWRPQNFQQVIGQQHVVQALINALDQQRLHHAYLFTGTRGVGKTTIARILAKCLNCERGVSSTPCEQCSTCEEINQGRFLDLLEVDAASRTKVEDTRELLENVQYAPTRGRYKVYIIDEVHMLSNHSFNALLKTLEEPPEHVKFILATTDPQKLPITVLSRCLQFHLKNMPIEEIVQQLKHILQQDNIPFEMPALTLLAHHAQGSMRDALSILDQALAYTNDHISLSALQDMLGGIRQQHIFNLVSAMVAGDGEQLLQIIQQMAEYAPDFSQALEQVIALLHQLALQKRIPQWQSESLFSQQQIIELAQSINEEDLQLYYQIALIGRRDLALTPSARSGFEMIMLRMLAFQPEGESVKKKPQSPVLASQ